MDETKDPERKRMVLWNYDKDGQLVPIGDFSCPTPAEKQETEKRSTRHSDCLEAIAEIRDALKTLERYIDDEE